MAKKRKNNRKRRRKQPNEENIVGREQQVYRKIKKKITDAQRRGFIAQAQQTPSSNYNKIIELCNKGILPQNRDFVNAQGYCFRGYAYAQKGDYPQAIEDCQRAIQFDKEYVQAYLFRGHAYLSNGVDGSNHSKTNYSAAISDYDQVINLGTNSKDIEVKRLVPQAYCFKGLVHSYNGDYEKAVENCNIGVDLAVSWKPNDFLAYCIRGYIHGYNNKFEEALEDHNEAIKVNSTSAMPYNNQVKCIRLFRPQFCKVKRRFFVEIP